jgi:hypothetical protein
MTVANNKRVLCAFKSECAFKKIISEEKSSQPNGGCAICTWKGRCNQQVDRHEPAARALLAFCYAA